MAEFVNTIDALGDNIVADSFIDRSITEFKDNAIVAIGARAFSDCTALTNIDLPSVTTIGQYAFNNCTALTNANIPLLTRAEGCLFLDCKKLQKIVLPAVTAMSFQVFNGCNALEYVDMACETLSGNFDTNMFSNCTSLATLIIRSTKLIGGCNSFASTAIASGNGYVYVPRALVDSYKAATKWSTYVSQFRALEDYTVDGTVTGELDESKI